MADCKLTLKNETILIFVMKHWGPNSGLLKCYVHILLYLHTTILRYLIALQFICSYLGLYLTQCSLSDDALNQLVTELREAGIQSEWGSRNTGWAALEWVEMWDNTMLNLSWGTAECHTNIPSCTFYIYYIIFDNFYWFICHRCPPRRHCRACHCCPCLSGPGVRCIEL